MKAEWGGPATEIADTVKVDADLTIRADGRCDEGRAVEYSGDAGRCWRTTDGQTRGGEYREAGGADAAVDAGRERRAGGEQGDPLTALKVDLSVRDLGEYDQLLQTLGVSGEREEGIGGDPGGAAWVGGLQWNGEGVRSRTWT